MGRRSEQIRWGRLKTRDLMLNYNGILGLILWQNIANHCKNTSTSLQLSVSGMLTHVFTLFSCRFCAVDEADSCRLSSAR